MHDCVKGNTLAAATFAPPSAKPAAYADSRSNAAVNRRRKARAACDS